MIAFTEHLDRIDVVVDVTAAVDLRQPLCIAATVFLPPPEMLTEHTVVIFGLPGGGYARGYFDMHFPGHREYSQAQHHARRGVIFVAMDHLGVGDSTPELCDRVRVEDIAAANSGAVVEISGLLSSGRLRSDYPAVRIGRRIGIGQSMGGAVTIIMAARHMVYDAIAVLGFSAIHIVLPVPTAQESAIVAARVSGNLRDPDARNISVAKSSALIPEFLYPFFWEDVPADIVEADTAGGYPLRQSAPPYGSLSLPSCAVAMLSPGYLTEEAAALRCPVFVGLGERDTALNPRGEPAAYENVCDVTVFICERMAHMHNFASTRVKLWDRLVSWYGAPAVGGSAMTEGR